MYINATDKEDWSDSIGSTADMIGIPEGTQLGSITVGVDLYDNGYQVNCSFDGYAKTFTYCIQECLFDRWINRIKIVREESLEDNLGF